MIPTYNDTKYLGGAIDSVLACNMDSSTMEIEVIDDHSPIHEIENIVRKVGQGRVKYYRQKENVGATKNFNTCVERAKGEYVHILHSDDRVLEGFYLATEQAFKSKPDIGAALCRYRMIDENGNALNESELLSDKAGVLSEFLDMIAIQQVVQPPSVAVRRRVYEEIGMYDTRLVHAADWDMWKRISCHYAVWYEPATLANYRVHAGSDTSYGARSGRNIRDIGTAIQISREYLPHAKRAGYIRKARKNYSEIGVVIGWQFFALNHDYIAGMNNILEAIKLWPLCLLTMKFWKMLIRGIVALFKDVEKTM